MNTLVTDRKYTVMLSAYQASNTEIENLIDTERMYDRLEQHYHVHAIRAVGVYHGGAEQSFIVHTNSSSVMHDIKRMGLEAYNQECVLVSNNRKHEIKLHKPDGNNQYIGERFTRHYAAPKGANSYTILNGKDYYTVS